jgi:hypothetical protein
MISTFQVTVLTWSGISLSATSTAHRVSLLKRLRRQHAEIQPRKRSLHTGAEATRL